MCMCRECECVMAPETPEQRTMISKVMTVGATCDMYQEQAASQRARSLFFAFLVCMCPEQERTHEPAPRFSFG